MNKLIPKFIGKVKRFILINTTLKTHIVGGLTKTSSSGQYNRETELPTEQAMEQTNRSEEQKRTEKQSHVSIVRCSFTSCKWQHIRAGIILINDAEKLDSHLQNEDR